MKIFSLFLFILLATNAAAAPKKKKNETLWQQWYVFSQNDRVVGRYFEEVELRPNEKQIAINQKWRETLPEGGKSEMFIGSVSQDNPKLTPVAFYVERKEENKQENIEARKKNNTLQIKITNNQGSNKKELTLPKDIILSAAFPLLVAKQGKSGNKKSFRYQAVVEDGREGDFTLVTGEAKINPGVEKISGEDCYKVDLVINELLSHWWITKTGKLCQAITPQVGNKIQMSTESAAKAALP